MDFATRVPGVSPLFISTRSPYSVAGQLMQGISGVVNLTPVAATVYYVPFFLPAPFTVRRFMFSRSTSTVTANYDVGVYSADEGELLCSTGSTSIVAPGSGSPISLINAATVTLLPPGRYFLAVVGDTGCLFSGFNPAATSRLQMVGVMTQASSGGPPLPTTIGSLARSTTAVYPYIGITQSTN